MEYLELGSVPSGEDCADHEDADQNRKECRLYKAQLERIFGIPDRLEDDIFFAVKSFKHEDGRYYQVVISYDDDNAEAAKLAARIANNLPDEWDDRSLRKLKGNKEAIATVKQDRAKHKKEKISKSVQDVREAYEVGKEIADLVFNVLERIF